MAGYLIKDTTKEEREQIVAQSLEYADDSCEGDTSFLREMYQDYIDGKRELKDINMAYHANYIMDDDKPERGGSCVM